MKLSASAASLFFLKKNNLLHVNSITASSAWVLLRDVCWYVSLFF